jgi:AcrR family transcriptional regulator
LPAGAAMDKPTDSTDRYARKKEAIVAAAAGIMNRRGVKGMTLADVAESVGLITTSVTYYFKKKVDLAVACFLSSIARFDALIDAALEAPDPRERLKRFITLYLDLNRRIREDEEAPMAMFNDIRALKEPHLSAVIEPYNAMFRKVRTLFDAPGYGWIDRKMATARAHILMEQIFWSVAWLVRYDREDYPRIASRMFDILSNGLAQEGAAWKPSPLALSPSEDMARETFLTAATRLINQRGYRGASVEKISAQLNVTKGSFYHHNDAKDDLVIACFERSFDIMRRVQSTAMKTQGTQWDRLCSAAAALVEYQVSDDGPLLRTDGIAEGSIRAADPVMAAQLLNATLNASATLMTVVRGAEKSEAAALYAKPMLMGLFSK